MCQSDVVFSRLIGQHCRSISCLALLAATGCTRFTRPRDTQSVPISNQDAAQLQPMVRSQSFTMRSADAARQLAGGIYGIENNQWRWTAGNFSLVLATPRGAATHGANLLLGFYIPDVIIGRTGPMTLTACLNGAEVGVRTYSTAGAHSFAASIAPELLSKSPVAIDFHLDRYVPSGAQDFRQLGVIAETVSLESE